MSAASKKGSNGELELRDLLRKAGYPLAERSGSAQRRKGPGLADVEGTPFWAENKNHAHLPLGLWNILDKCAADREPLDRRPILVRLNRTGRKHRPLVVMFADEWADREAQIAEAD